MSAFFDWDTDLVKVALLKKLGEEGAIPDPGDCCDEWYECEINVPELEGQEYYTRLWDVNFSVDDEGLFSITAYPLTVTEKGEHVGDYSSWITLLERNINND